MTKQMKELNEMLTLGPEELKAHMGIARYNDFTLTGAIRPSYDLKVVPRSGYRHDRWQDAEVNIPVLIASVSREKLFDAFLDLLDPLGDWVEVVMESSHRIGRKNRIIGRVGGCDVVVGSEDRPPGRDCGEHDLPVLKSTLYDFEDLLLNDGCCGIAVLNPDILCEVFLDEHKLLVVYGDGLEPFEDVLNRHGIPCDDALRLITEAEHVHSSDARYLRQFEVLCRRLGGHHDGEEYQGQS